MIVDNRIVYILVQPLDEMTDEASSTNKPRQGCVVYYFAYLVSIPGIIGRLSLWHEYDAGNKDCKHRGRCDEHPAYLPEDVRSTPSHELYVIWKPDNERRVLLIRRVLFLIHLPHSRKKLEGLFFN